MLKKWLMSLLLLPAVSCATPLTIEQVAPGIYVHYGVHKDINTGYGGDICNIGFIIGNKGLAVIDTGGSPKVGRELHEAIRKVTRLPILYVINTHVHPDHVFGNAAFKADHPEFVGHANLAGMMLQRHDVYLRNQVEWTGEDGAGSELIPPTLPVLATQTLDLGGRLLQLTAYQPAHSTSDLSVFDDTTRTLWTGDLLFIERTPSVDGELKGWIKVIEQLRSFKAAHTVPGHGPVTTDLQGALDNENRYFSVLMADVRADIKQGKSIAQATEDAAQSEQSKWILFNVINRRNAANLFPVLEWE